MELRSKSSLSMAECVWSVLDLLFYDDIELPDSDVSEEDNGGDPSYLIDSPLHACMLANCQLE